MPFTTLGLQPLRSSATSSQNAVNDSQNQGDLRNRVPVTETDICTPFVAAVELVIEETKFRLRGNAPAPDLSVDGQVIAGGNERPVVGDLDGNRPVQSANLHNCQATIRRYGKTKDKPESCR